MAQIIRRDILFQIRGCPIGHWLAPQQNFGTGHIIKSIFNDALYIIVHIEAISFFCPTTKTGQKSMY